MNFIIGDSRVRGLKDTVSNLQFTEVWSRPGAKISDVFEMVEGVTVLHHGAENSRSHIYIIVGICNLTDRLKDHRKKYEEVIFNKIKYYESKEKIKNELIELAKYAIKQYSAVIFCTIYPMNLSTWNHHRLKSRRTSYLQFESQYSEMQSDLEKAVCDFNQFIIKMNAETGLATPMLNRDFLRNRSKGRKEPRYCDLHDGCHPNVALNEKFKVTLNAACKRNEKKMRS